MRRILLVSPYFPPMAVVGAKRALNLVRHLPSVGYEPVVLAAHPDRERCDPAHAALVPEEVVVRRGYGGAPPPKKKGEAKKPRGKKPAWRQRLALRTKYLTPLDRYIWLTPEALRAGRALIEEHGLQAILVNADPWAGLVMGDLLSRQTGLPLVCDLRDSWSLHHSKMALRPRVSQALLRRLEERIFRQASRVVVNTESAHEAYVEVYRGRLPAERFTFVRNAYDRSLFPATEAGPDPEVFTMAYFGSFRHLVRPDELLAAFAALVKRRELPPEKARFVFYGATIEPEVIARYGIGAHCDFHPAVGFTEAMSVLRKATVLCLVASTHDALQIPSKLYDYLAAERPIFGIVADAPANEEVRRIVDETGTGRVARFGDREGAAEALVALYDAPVFAPNREAVASYGVGAQVKKLAAVLDDVLDG